MSKGYGGFLKAWEKTVRKTQARTKKKANSIFTAMSVAPADDEPGPGEIYRDEKVLENGELYTGQFVDNLPHGHGKYLWTDGCMYVGEWQKGQKVGKGKFSWPSGATYEGDFKDDFMNGKGTYVGSSGGTYKGSWVMNLKHGQGTKNYDNGDYYDGEWRRGLQNGQGRYQWKNGNNYIGQWRNGMINGNGTMVWRCGNHYDGYWEDGFPKGTGTFRWSDGSFYVGVWSKNVEEQSGTYYPSDTIQGNIDWDPQEVFSVHLNHCKICLDDTISIFPSYKTLNWPGMEGVNKKGGFEGGTMPRRLPNGGNERNGVEDSDITGKHVRPQSRRNPVKRPGKTISKGHKNYELMLNLQLGIRHSVGRPAPATSLDLKSSAFDPKEKLWTKFPPEGSKYTPPHQSSNFKWKDYCPVVFRTLRKLFKVDAADYMISLCGNDALRELSSPGKSGSFFYLTHDDRYMIKTMKKAEVKVLIRMLPAYYNHVRSFENTLITRFYGLHCVKLTGTAQKKVRFVIMGNLFCCEYVIHRRFDLKGSSHGRKTDKPEAEIDGTTTLKDLDLTYIFQLQRVWFQEFCRQVDRDCDFLEQERIMDYSLLVGLHFRENSYQGSAGNVDPDEATSIRIGINMPAKAERTVRRGDPEAQLVGEPTGELYDVILIFGIIDILQDYDISKKLEHAYKSFQYDPTSISAVDPKQYSKRFRDFIFRVFVEDT